jgi:uncharacterized protein (TIGR03437 family)
VAVTFDGIPGRLLYTGERQINVEVPGELAAKASVQMVVTVDGAGSAPRAVTLAAAAPAIFAGGVLNQDGSVNGPAAPAPVGSVLQIFLTGLPATGAPVVVKLHDREDLPPAYAGAAPGSPGLQQVNIPVPEDLPAMTTEVVICTFGAGSRKVCSRPALITLSTP